MPYEYIQSVFGTTAADVSEQRVMIGAASRGIIQKEYQHDAKVYKTAYEKNPFDKVNDDELQEYTQQFAAPRHEEDEQQLDESMLSDEAPEGK